MFLEILQEKQKRNVKKIEKFFLLFVATTILNRKTKLLEVQNIFVVISDDLLDVLTFKIDDILDFVLEMYNIYELTYGKTSKTSEL